MDKKRERKISIQFAGRWCLWLHAKHSSLFWKDETESNWVWGDTELKLWVRAGFTSRQCASLKTCQLYNQTVISPFAYPSTILFFPPPPDLYFLFPSMPMDFSKGLWIRWQKKTIWLSTVTSCFSSWKMFYWSTAIFIDMTKKRITSVM